jgi:hypothetical protein
MSVHKKFTKGPTNIFIIRHAEDLHDEFPLDCNGILRSIYIPDLISEFNSIGIGIHSFITPISHNTIHKQQTIMLSCWIMDLPIFMYGLVNDPDIAVRQLFANPTFTGKNVIFCWKHKCMQSLIQSILNIGGVAKGLKNYQFKNTEGNSMLPFWTHKNYSSILRFDNELNFSIMEQSLINGVPKNSVIKYGKIQNCKSKNNLKIV